MLSPSRNITEAMLQFSCETLASQAPTGQPISRTPVVVAMYQPTAALISIATSGTIAGTTMALTELADHCDLEACATIYGVADHPSVVAAAGTRQQYVQALESAIINRIASADL
jgi:hypothetical protein